MGGAHERTRHGDGRSSDHGLNIDARTTSLPAIASTEGFLLKAYYSTSERRAKYLDTPHPAVEGR